MRILIPVFFHAPMGGLHYHVLASIRYLKEAGHDITVVCKSGPFAEQATELGVHVFLTEFTSEDIHRLLLDLAHYKFDVVYAHPFHSRQIGLTVAEVQQIPFVLVIHGMYDDDLSYYVDQTSHVIAVSDSIADYLSERCEKLEGKMTVLMNGVDERYMPTPLPPKAERLSAVYVARMDADMIFPLDVLLDGVGDEQLKEVPIDWTFIGSGTQQEKYKARFEEKIRGSNQSINWIGWQETDDVVAWMKRSDFVVAPSRVAIESLALGRPTIAIGSKGYHGLVTTETWEAAEATNFGGIGTRAASYEAGMVAEEILKLCDFEYRSEIAEFSGTLGVRYRDTVIQSRLLQLLEEVVEADVVPSPINYAVARYEQLHLHRANNLLAQRLADRERKLQKRHQS